MNRFKSRVPVILMISLITGSAGAMDPSVDWDELEPGVMIEDEARAIAEVFDRYHRSLDSLMCKGEIRGSLKGRDFNDVMFLSARAQRPNLVEVAVVGKSSLFPTDIFISNGTELFEQSIKFLNYMISPAPSEFQSLHDRVIARSAPNVPVEVITSLMSDSPMQNLLQVSSEPGLVRLIGTAEVNGVKCHEIGVNELGTRIWISEELPPRLMRYRSSPELMKPRYLPEGAIVTGPQIVIDFKTWGVSDDLTRPWKWSVPGNSNRMATMHENAARPGPEAGYKSMIWEGAESKPTDGPTMTRGVDPKTDGTEAGASITVGSTSPETVIVSQKGIESSLESIRNGRPAIVIFWVPNGKFSRSSMPDIIGAARAASKQAVVIPIGSPIGPAAAVDNRNMVKLESWCDPRGSAAKRFGVFEQPAIFIIDSDGTISDRYVGPQPRFSSRMTDLVEALENRHPIEGATSESPEKKAPQTDEDPS